MTRHLFITLALLQIGCLETGLHAVQDGSDALDTGVAPDDVTWDLEEEL